MNCRGHKNRLEIIHHYDVKPIAQLKLLNGRKLPGDAGKDIEDKYFIFECKSKTKENIEIIYCGRPTAVDFCNIINKPLPALFNPLKSEISQNNTTKSSCKDLPTSVKWNKTRLQLYNAVMIIISFWNAKPGTALFEIKDFLENPKYINYKPLISKIKAVNTILQHSSTTMTDIVVEIAINNPIKIFSFSLLSEELQKNGIEQFFER